MDIKKTLVKGRLTYKSLTFLALLIALNIVLGRMLSISTPITRISLSFLPVALGGMLLGPLGGAAVGGLGDLLGALLFPIGAYFPGYTLTAVISGAVFGLFLSQSPYRLRFTMVSVLFNQAFCSLFLNSLWVCLLTPKKSLGVIVLSRVIQCVIMTAVQLVTLHLAAVGLHRTSAFSTLKNRLLN